MDSATPYEVLFYQTRRGTSPVRDFLRSLAPDAHAKCARYMAALEQQGLALPASFIKKVADDLWELRPEYNGVEYRFFYFTFVDRKFVVVHALKKKTQKTRRQDISLAMARIREIRERTEEIEKNATPELQIPSTAHR